MKINKFVIISLLISLAFMNVLDGSKVMATDRAMNLGYFSNDPFNDTGNQVIRGGIPPKVNSKITFINFIKDLYNKDCREVYDCKNNKVGAAYIIQTMRGEDPTWDHDMPSPSDIASWEAKINSELIYINTVQSYGRKTFTVNTRSNPDTFDVSKYSYNQSKSITAVVFYSSNGNEYIIKKDCGNPIGDFNGLPPPVIKNYNLTPSLSLSQSGAVEPGVTLNITSKITNSGERKSDLAEWKLTSKVTRPGRLEVGSDLKAGKHEFPIGTTAHPVIPDVSDIINDYESGTKICYSLSVKPYSNTTSAWRSSEPKCIKIGKKPKTQVWGSDLYVGGVAITGISVKTNAFGSWVEYGIFAGSYIKGTASGSAFSGAGLAGDTVAKHSALSFANTGNKGTCTGAGQTIGCYAPPSSPDVSASFPNNNEFVGNASFAPDKKLAAPGIRVIAGKNITLTDSTLTKGESIIIKATGTVTIAGNQKYHSGPYSNIRDIPQLVIIAKNINIQDNVTQVDAWLVAKSDKTSSVNTCSTKTVGAVKSALATGDRLSSGICGTQLTINGAVMTNHLYLRRTAGSGTAANSGDPAEIINLRSDAYLWAINRASNYGRINTVHTTELPPRL